MEFKTWLRLFGEYTVAKGEPFHSFASIFNTNK